MCLHRVRQARGWITQNISTIRQLRPKTTSTRSFYFWGLEIIRRNLYKNYNPRRSVCHKLQQQDAWTSVNSEIISYIRRCLSQVFSTNTQLSRVDSLTNLLSICRSTRGIPRKRITNPNLHRLPRCATDDSLSSKTRHQSAKNPRSMLLRAYK